MEHVQEIEYKLIIKIKRINFSAGEVTEGIKIVKQSLIFQKGNRSKCIFLNMLFKEEDCSH